MNSPETGTWQVVTDETGVRNLREDWNRLFAANPRHRPFLAWSWVIAWLDHLAGPHKPHIICLRGANQQLEFVLPLVRSTENGRYRVPRLNAVCGYGTECSDHVGVLRLPSLDAQAAELVVNGIAATCNIEDRIELGNFDNLDEFSMNISAALAENRRFVLLEQSAACPVVSLPDSWDGYLQSLSRNFRSQVRRNRKRIDTTENLIFRSLDPSEAESFAHDLIRLNRSRMGDKGKVSSLEDPAFREFLISAIPGMALEGVAWMDVVERDGQVVGAAFNLAHGRSIYYYLGGFDESAKNLQPGVALFVRVLKRGIEQGYTSYDFLRGAEPYKYRWGAADTRTFHISVYPQGIVRGQLACRIDRLRNSARAMIRKIREKTGPIRSRD